MTPELEQDIIEGVAKFNALFSGSDWQAMMHTAAEIRATGRARYSEAIAQAEALEQRAHELAKQSGDLGYLS